MRRAARVDNNQGEIIQAMRNIGAKVYYVKKPLDILVGFRGLNILLEIKNPHADRGNPTELTEAEEDFIATWPGQCAVVESVEQALAVVVEAARPR